MSLKIATKQLIVNVASSHGMTPLDVLAIHTFCRTQKSYNPASMFSVCLYACKTNEHPKSFKSFFKQKRARPITDEQYLAIREKFADTRYYFLYDFVENFYVQKHHKLFYDGAKRPPKFNYASLPMKLTYEIADAPVPKHIESSKVAKPSRELTDAFKLLLDLAELPTNSDTFDIAAEKAKAKSQIILPPTPKIIIPTAAESPIKWGAQQRVALDGIFSWLRTDKRSRAPIYRLFGYAGTGKTYLAQEVQRFVMSEQSPSNNIPMGDVLFAAFAGKAASVLRISGCRGAQTLHSLLYKPLIDPKTGRCIGFIINPESPLAHASLLIVDEVSMVNEDMAKDMLSFGVPILVLGDPAQLKPVTGEGYFINARPDSMLTDIRRQAKDNPIIYLATRAREHQTLKVGKYGESQIFERNSYISNEFLASHDQIICGKNATRKSLNIRMRKINGKYAKDSMFPVKGDRLICLKNNSAAGLYNGTMWTSSKIEVRKIMQPKFKGSFQKVQGDQDILFFKVRSEDEMNSDGDLIILETQVSPHMFNSALPEPMYRAIAGCDEFDFGYAITCHKAQGSQWKSIYIQDESQVFGEERWNHIYTALTRASERATIVL